jgi:uroporphyrinogen-III synthase
VAKVPEPIVHQQLIESIALSECAPDTHVSALYKTVDPRPAPLDLSFFSAVIFSSPSTVEAFKEIYGGYPDHLLCYAFDDATREALQKKDIHPWRIVTCPVI